MKFEKKEIPPQPKKFEKVAITITFESQDELDRFYAIANSTFVCGYSGMDAQLGGLRKSLVGIGATYNSIIPKLNYPSDTDTTLKTV